MIKYIAQKLFLITLCGSLMACQTDLPKIERPQSPKSPEQDSITRDRRVQDFVFRADNLMRRGKNVEAVDELNAGLALEPDSYTLNQQLGRALVLTKDYEGAERHLRKTQAEKPDDPFNFNYIAMMYLHQHRYKEALDNNLKAQTINPDDPYSNLAVAWDHAYLNEKDQAYESFVKYLKSGDRSSRSEVLKWITDAGMVAPEYQSKAATLIADKKFDEAEIILKELEQNKEVDEDGNSQLSRAYNDIEWVPKNTSLLKEWAGGKS